MFYYLDDYRNIGPNQLLKIRLKEKEGFLYGTIGWVDVTGSSSTLRRSKVSKITSGMLQHFTNYEACLAEDAPLPHFESLPIKSHDIESIGIIVNAIL